MRELIECSDITSWRNILDRFSRVDVCHMPEYHSAYSTRFEGARALLWTFEKDSHSFAYPFLLSPVIIQNDSGVKENTGYFDISGIYGFSTRFQQQTTEIFSMNAGAPLMNGHPKKKSSVNSSDSVSTLKITNWRMSPVKLNQIDPFQFLFFQSLKMNIWHNSTPKHGI